jgi:pimeloyl-ACP methyl ester carboxylesterase
METAMTEITPFRIAISDAEITDLKARIANARWARPDPVGDWSRGVPRDYLEGLAAYWGKGFDWRRQEAALNALPQFTTEIDGQTFHFVHVKSKEKNARPILLCNGWPGSFAEFSRIIGPLTDPVAHGGRAEDAFDVVVPSLPGFGFSLPLSGPGWDLPRTTRAYATIMERLGHAKYVAHGSDIGSGIAGHIASFFPDRVTAVHVASDRGTLNYAGVFLPLPPDLSDAEKAELEAIKAAGRDGDGYMRQQSTMPQTLAYGLGDSPIGQLAWIAEKFAAWTNPAKPLPDQAVDRDQLLTNVSLYWFGNSGGSSAQFYWETAHAKAGWTAPSAVPTGWSVFHAHPLMRRIMDAEHKHAFWSEHVEGGHFPAMEEPDLLVGDLRAFFRTQR